MIIKYISLIFMTLLGAVGALYFKKASNSSNIFKILFKWELYFGGFLYFASAVINIWVLKYIDYSVVLPLTSITYIWTMMLSRLILKEKITQKKIVGITLIILGACAVSL